MEKEKRNKNGAGDGDVNMPMSVLLYVCLNNIYNGICRSVRRKQGTLVEREREAGVRLHLRTNVSLSTLSFSHFAPWKCFLLFCIMILANDLFIFSYPVSYTSPFWLKKCQCYRIRN